MSFDVERLYELLPAIYRLRDAEHGATLKALLGVIAEQVAVLEENLAQIYDDQFIETCAPWVVPYIGDVIGYRSVHGVAPRVGSPRAEVAHTIGFRRRKGTAAVLEQLARDVTGWHARAVEFFQLLGATQHMNHVRPEHWYTPALRQSQALEHLHTPFDHTAHTVEVRRIGSRQGRYNIPNLGIFLWRLQPYPLTNCPAFKVDDHRYIFSPLGNNMPLFTRPVTEDDVAHLAEPINVPMPISRRMLSRDLAAYYGASKSMCVRRDGVEVEATQVQAYNLADVGDGTWAHQPSDTVAIDPVLGRLAFPTNQSPPGTVQVTFHYGFSADMGGGEYERAASFDTLLQPVRQVSAPDTIQTALNARRAGGVVEISDNGRYSETLSVVVNAGQRLELRAANQHRPTLAVRDMITIRGGADAEITLNGLLITGGALRVVAANNQLRRLRLRHCTLVPGLSLTANGTPEHADSPSVIVEAPEVTVEIEHSIVGSLRVVDGAQVRIAHSIVDATSETGVAYAALDGAAAGGALQIVDSTIIGTVHTVLLELASNTIFLAALAPAPEEKADTQLAPIMAQRRQAGCVRFSSLPLSAVVPPRFRCQPYSQSEARRLRPQFTSLHYGDPGYGQLAPHCAVEIRTGADDEAEMGAWHTLYQPQREINLRVRLDEYLRFGLEAGVFYVT
ncbi:MAG TPA: hypothetical protein VI542_29290 [Candidatus Tectomicrobia bacterium]